MGEVLSGGTPEAEPRPEFFRDQSFGWRQGVLFAFVRQGVVGAATIDAEDAGALSGLAHTAIELNSATTSEVREGAQATYDGISAQVQGVDAREVAVGIESFRRENLGRP